jgi:hypothetical protein
VVGFDECTSNFVRFYWIKKLFIFRLKITVLTFFTYLYSDDTNSLEPTITYVCLSLFNKIRIPLFMLGPSISSLVQVINSIICELADLLVV